MSEQVDEAYTLSRGYCAIPVFKITAEVEWYYVWVKRTCPKLSPRHEDVNKGHALEIL